MSIVEDITRTENEIEYFKSVLKDLNEKVFETRHTIMKKQTLIYSLKEIIEKGGNSDG